MKKNMLLLISLCILAYSASIRAAKKEKWIPKYQQKKITKRLDLKKKSSVKNNDYSNLSAKQINLIKKYEKPLKKKFLRNKLIKDTLNLAQKAVPVLTRVMKGSDYPENNRWLATFMLGRVMGKKAAPFISKFSAHPHWMLRLASLKVLLALGQKQYQKIYIQALKDKAMIVRHQALENINRFELKSLAPYVWGMLYDKTNYKGDRGGRKRTNIIKEVILSMGNLGFEKAKKPMLKMIQNRKYKDIYSELDQSLSKLSKTPSPKGNITSKQYFWSRQALKETTI